MRQITVTEHLLLHQTQSPAATGHFTRLLYDLILSAKIISRSLNSAGLLDVLGATGTINVQGERVQKLDELANDTIIHRMERTGVLCGMASEENADIIRIPRSLRAWRISAYFRPPGRFIKYRRQYQCGHHFFHFPARPRQFRRPAGQRFSAPRRGTVGGRVFCVRIFHNDGLYHGQRGTRLHSGPHSG